MVRFLLTRASRLSPTFPGMTGVTREPVKGEFLALFPATDELALCP